jgi:ATP-dependent Clp protease ATP-binding subunit ClpA
MYPFERFTEAAKRALTFAQEEAERSHSGYIGPEHVLLGLMREGDSVAASVLNNLGVQVTQVRTSIEAILGTGGRTGIQQIIPTLQVKKVIEVSFEEARRMGDNYVGTEHILLGLHVEGENIASHILQDIGAGRDRVRAEIERLRAAGASTAEEATATSGLSERIPAMHIPSEVLARAGERAATEEARQVDGAHLLWALLESDEARVRFALLEAGADLDRLRELLMLPEALIELRRRLRDAEAETRKASDKHDYTAAGSAYDREQQLRAELAKLEAEWSNPGAS